MANLNLSQFGENTSVSDADYTFVWDSAASISKKVSRNSWLNSGELTSSAPVTISQTWNQIGTAFTAFKVNAVSTASASGSLLLDLQVGGVSKSKVDKGGFITAAGVFVNVVGKAISNPAGQELGFGYTNNGCAFYRYSTTIASFVNSASVGGNSSGLNLGTDALGFASSAEGALSVVLLRDGADNTLALRNGAAAQTFRVYGAYPDTGINYARLALSCDTSGNATISTQALGTYTAGTVSINGVPVGRGKGNLTENIGIGTNALASITTGVGNVAIGVNALQNNTAQGNSVAIGLSAQINGGSQSIAIGSLTSMVAANQSVAVGYGALSTATHTDAIGIGWASLYATQANNVVALGTNSGRYIANGSTANAVATNSIFIGGLTKALDTAQTNQIVIGYDATGIGSNSVVLGNDSITKTALKGNVGIGTTSPTSKLHVAGTIKPEQATMVDTALTTYTLASTDAGTIINSTSATAVTVNLPTADTAAGYNVMIIQSGAGAVTIAANGNTLNSFGNALITAGQHAACSIVRTAASTYNLSGNLV